MLQKYSFYLYFSFVFLKSSTLACLDGFILFYVNYYSRDMIGYYYLRPKLKIQLFVRFKSSYYYQSILAKSKLSSYQSFLFNIYALLGPFYSDPSFLFSYYYQSDLLLDLLSILITYASFVASKRFLFYDCINLFIRLLSYINISLPLPWINLSFNGLPLYLFVCPTGWQLRILFYRWRIWAILSIRIEAITSRYSLEQIKIGTL